MISFLPKSKYVAHLNDQNSMDTRVCLRGLNDLSNIRINEDLDSLKSITHASNKVYYT